MGLGPDRSANWMRRISSVYDLPDDRAEKNTFSKKKSTEKYFMHLHIFLHIFCYMHLNIFKCSQPAVVTHSMLVSPVLFLSYFGCGPFSGL